MDLTKKLSKHFTLGEMVRTSHRLIDNTPSQQQIANMSCLCDLFLEPIHKQFGPLWITSGYRCPALNQLVGSSAASAHLHGCAADFVPMWNVRPITIVEWVTNSRLPYDQIIDEYSSTSNWVHLGIVLPGTRGTPRREA